MGRRLGWAILAVVSGAFFVLTALGTAWQVGLAISVREAPAAAESAVVGLLVLVFWRWIALGAWLRYRPPLDPETGLPVRGEEPVGPWGWVGRILMAVLVVGLVGGAVVARTAEVSSTRAAQRAADRAQQAARRQDLTVADVERAVTDARVWLASGSSGPDPYTELLEVDGASVADVDVVDGTAVLLLRTSESPPCVVLTVDRRDVRRTRLTSDC